LFPVTLNAIINARNPAKHLNEVDLRVVILCTLLVISGNKT